MLKPAFTEKAGSQRGMTLIETMVALGIGVVVIGAMVAMMANSLSAASKSTRMARLQQDVRTVMQMITRDIRRAAYNAEAIKCFGNMDCATDGSFAAGAIKPDLTINSANNCVIFYMDRDHDGNMADDPPAGFRLRTVNGVGRMQMWVGDASAGVPTCTSGSKWVDITDQDVIDVTQFLICGEIVSTNALCDDLDAAGADDPDLPDALSYDDQIDNDGAGTFWFQRVRKVQIVLDAELISDSNIRKKLIDRIRVRNDMLYKVVTP